MGKYEVTHGPLNVRCKPGANAKVVRKLEKGKLLKSINSGMNGLILVFVNGSIPAILESCWNMVKNKGWKLPPFIFFVKIYSKLLYFKHL